MHKHLLLTHRLAEAEAVLAGDENSVFVSGSSNGITDRVASEYGDTSAFALQVRCVPFFNCCVKVKCVLNSALHVQHYNSNSILTFLF